MNPKAGEERNTPAIRWETKGERRGLKKSRMQRGGNSAGNKVNIGFDECGKKWYGRQRGSSEGSLGIECFETNRRY